MKIPNKHSTRLERITDSVLSLFAPKRAIVRQHLRAMDRNPDYRDAALLGMRLRGYRSAKSSTGNTPWMGGTKSADAEIAQDLPALRNRSREINRDDPIGSGLTKTFVNNVINTGIRPQVRTDDDEKNKRMESVWKSRCNELSPVEGLTHPEAQRLLLAKVLEDGDVLRKPVYSNDSPVYFETIEADRLQTPASKGRDPRFRQGVEVDGNGIPVRYWILKAHPGDTAGSGVGRSDADYMAVDADMIRHLKTVTRPGQTRGVPVFHAILQDLRDLDLLLLASLKRSQIAACLAIFIKSSSDITDVVDVTADKYGYKLDQDIEPGMIFKLFPGESVETLVPNFPIPELTPFIIMLARRIGAALGVSWQIVLKDFSQSNYSSARTDLLEARQTYQVLQTWFIEKYLTWEWRVVLEDARLRGDARMTGISDEEIAAVTWITPGWRWVDPLKEAKATEVELQIRTTTLRDVCAMKGDDWEEIQDQLLREELREIQRRKQLGLPEKQAVSSKQPSAEDLVRSLIEEVIEERRPNE